MKKTYNSTSNREFLTKKKNFGQNWGIKKEFLIYPLPPRWQKTLNLPMVAWKKLHQDNMISSNVTQREKTNQTIQKFYFDFFSFSGTYKCIFSNGICGKNFSVPYSIIWRVWKWGKNGIFVAVMQKSMAQEVRQKRDIYTWARADPLHTVPQQKVLFSEVRVLILLRVCAY